MKRFEEPNLNVEMIDMLDVITTSNEDYVPDENETPR